MTPTQLRLVGSRRVDRPVWVLALGERLQFRGVAGGVRIGEGLAPVQNRVDQRAIKDGRAERVRSCQGLGRRGEDLVAAAVPLGATLCDEALGQIEAGPFDQKAQRGVDEGRGERMGEGGVERVDVLEIGEMREMLA